MLTLGVQIFAYFSLLEEKNKNFLILNQQDVVCQGKFLKLISSWKYLSFYFKKKKL